MTRNIVRRSLVATALLVAPAIANAQQTAKPATTTTVNTPIEFSGILYPQFIYGGSKGTNRSANQFQLERAYLTARAKISDRAGIRLTADIYRPGGANGYVMRAKYAYLQYDYWMNNEGLAGLNAQTRLGMQQTVIIEQTEQYWPRYIAKVALERAGFFYASDLGASTTMSFGNGLGEAFAMVSNGPGFTTPENDRFKDYSARLTLAPFRTPGAMQLTISPWIYKGAVASALRPSDSRKRDRAGVFAGLKLPALAIGGDFAQSTNENENVIPGGINTTDRSGKVVSAFATLKPFAMMNPNGNKAWGVVLRWDNITGETGYVPNATADFPVLEGRFVVAGITNDINNRLSWSLDYQQQSPRGNPAPAYDLRTYNLHVSAAF